MGRGTRPQDRSPLLRIEDFRREAHGDHTSLRARVVWEDSDRPPLELYFKTDAFPDGCATIEGNPFLVACGCSARFNELDCEFNMYIE